ncbi:MAG: DUF4062 domain-containing protein [Sedimentisphaerales bacterium]
MEPWSVDAREAIRNTSEIRQSLIEQTEGIEDFLSKDRYFFVVATKGLGKSLLLLAKRKILQDKRIDNMIPRSALLDIPAFTIASLGESGRSRLRCDKTMQLLWSISIAIAIIKNLELTEEIKKGNISDTLLRLLEEKANTATDILAQIIVLVQRDEFYGRLADEYNRILIPTIRTIQKSIALFIDNVDECFKDEEIKIWNTAQSSLVRAIYELFRLNPGKLKLFASIRKEAFLQLKKDNTMYLQYEGISLDISYHKDELKKIFIKNINAEKRERLLRKDSLRTDPIYAFIGIKEVQHGHVVTEKEEIFDYIYRHTLKRPRDFMVIGNRISTCPTNERNPENPNGISKVKNLINEAATKIAETYIEENIPHLTVTKEDLDRVFGLIDSNILEKQKIKKICMQFNGNDASCMDRDCKNCSDKNHIFCQLFKMGLLGYVTEDPTEKNLFVQKFATVGERIYDDAGLLPDSTHYLIHPILDHLIRTRSSGYKYTEQIDKVNIVGCDRPWNTIQQVPSENMRRPTVFISSTMDLSEYRNKIEKMVIDKEFAAIRSEQQNDANAFKKCKDEARKCHFFVAILGSRYGDEYRGKSICEHEFDAAYTINPQKIIVYMIDGDMNNWDEKQKEFAQKIQSIKQRGFLRGGRINLSNIHMRFEKDFVEKIALLVRKKGNVK